MIYMDYAATTKPKKAVLEAMQSSALAFYGNPSSLHDVGIDAKKRYNQAKINIAKTLNVSNKEIIFTSGGTEAINTVLKSHFFKYPNKTIVTTSIEHAAGKNTAQFIKDQGGNVTYLKNDPFGFVDLDHLKQILKHQEVSLVSIIYINNELGTKQNIEALCQLKREYPFSLHLDMVQAPAHERLDLKAFDIDYVSFSAHKFYGPRGVGMLYAKNPDKLENHMHGGSHELGKRAGTENLPGIIGMEKALELIQQKPENTAHVERLAAYFIESLEKNNIDFRLNGPALDHSRIPGILNLGFKDEDAQMMAFKLNEHGIFISIGSACHAQVIEPSHVLKHIGVPKDYLYGSMRFSFSDQERFEDIDNVVAVIKHLITSNETKNS